MAIVHLPGRAILRVDGAEAEPFLHGLVTTDIAGLPAAVARPGALLSPQGKILFDFLIWRTPTGFMLEVASAQAADLSRRLGLYRLRSKVTISQPEQALVAVGWDFDSAPSDADSTTSGDDSTLDGRFPIAVRRWHGDAAPAADTPASAFDELRIAHGIAELGPDYPAGEAFPHDVNLDQCGGLSFRKGCYVGQEVVSRMQHRGTARRRVLIATAAAPLAAGAEITAAGRPVGRIGTAQGRTGLAIARLDRVSEAVAASVPLLAGEVAITLALPPGVSYGWPAPGMGGDEP